MGTGSVTLWVLRMFYVCRRCLYPFSEGECRAPWKKGTGTEWLRFSSQLGLISARSQSPFSTTAYSLCYQLPDPV
jgi:hypothetical protein